MFKQEKLTCPFTGVKFYAVINSDNTISIPDPLTDNIYNFKIHGNAITIPLELFNYTETVTYTEAAKILDVSLPRISKIAKVNILPTYKINGKKVFKLTDILKYKELRKIGKQNKE